jgi:predicted nuclease with TOPRIM domain
MKPSVHKILTKLSQERVDLSLVNDAKKIQSDYASVEEDSAFSFVVKAELAYVKILNKYQSMLKEVESIKPKLEKAIQEIGINRNNFQVLDDLDKNKSDIKERIKSISKKINDLKSINP